MHIPSCLLSEPAGTTNLSNFREGALQMMSFLLELTFFGVINSVSTSGVI